MRRVMVVAAIGVLAACGSSSGGSAEKASFVDAAMKGYEDAPASTKEVMSESEARCLVSGLVDIVGVDNLAKADVKPSDLSTSTDSPFSTLGQDMTTQQANDAASLITDGKCFDFTDVVMSQMKGSSNPFGKLEEKKVRCLFDKILSDPIVKKGIANSFLGKGDGSELANAFSDQSSLFSMLGDCDINPSELSG